MPGITQTLRNSLIALAFVPAIAFAKCSETHVDLRWDGGTARFNVEIADDFEERAKGLMFREKLGRYSGMLFIYEQPIKASFWMKNTLIPLDMIFLDQHGTVKHIHENAIPHDLTSIFGGEGILAVLEINGGQSSKLGLTVGAQMRHPAFAQGPAVWPCS